VIAFLGCIGLLVDSHLMYTDIALLAGFALSFYGLALSRTRPVLAGVALGTGVGIGFMSKGLIAPAQWVASRCLCPHCSALGAIATTRAALRSPSSPQRPG